MRADQEGTSPAERAEVAVAVYEKIQAYWGPIIGSAGVHALFNRSASLERAEFPWLAGAVEKNSAEELRERLRAQDSAIAEKAAESLFATFFTLMATFIGEPLTKQLQRSAWPALNDDAAPKEREK